MSKSLVFVLLAVFLLVLGTFVSGTILTPYAQEIGAAWYQIGILSGAMYAVRLFIGARVGRLSDKKGALVVLKYSLMLYPLIAVAYWFSTNIYLLIGARLIHGVASAMMLPVAMAYVGQASPQGKEGRYMSLYNACILIASGIGPFISALVNDYFNDYRSTFIILFFLALAALVIILFSGNTPKAGGNNTVKHKGAENSKLDTVKLLDNKGLLALGCINIALAVVSSLVGFFLVPYLKSLNIDFIYIGSVIAIYNIFSGISLLPLGRTVDKYDKFRIALLSGVVTAGALFAIPAVNNIYMIGFTMILIAFGSAMLLSASSALSAIAGRRTGMGSTMGLLSTFNSIGMIFGCLALSLMPQIGLEFRTFFFLSGIIVILSIILFSILWLSSNISYKSDW